MKAYQKYISFLHIYFQPFRFKQINKLLNTIYDSLKHKTVLVSQRRTLEFLLSIENVRTNWLAPLASFPLSLSFRPCFPFPLSVFSPARSEQQTYKIMSFSMNELCFQLDNLKMESFSYTIRNLFHGFKVNLDLILNYHIYYFKHRLRVNESLEEQIRLLDLRSVKEKPKEQSPGRKARAHSLEDQPYQAIETIMQTILGNSELDAGNMSKMINNKKTEFNLKIGNPELIMEYQKMVFRDISKSLEESQRATSDLLGRISAVPDIETGKIPSGLAEVYRSLKHLEALKPVITAGVPESLICESSSQLRNKHKEWESALMKKIKECNEHLAIEAVKVGTKLGHRPLTNEKSTQINIEIPKENKASKEELAEKVEELTGIIKRSKELFDKKINECEFFKIQSENMKKGLGENAVRLQMSERRILILENELKNANKEREMFYGNNLRKANEIEQLKSLISRYVDGQETGRTNGEKQERMGVRKSITKDKSNASTPRKEKGKEDSGMQSQEISEHEEGELGVSQDEIQSYSSIVPSNGSQKEVKIRRKKTHLNSAAQKSKLNSIQPKGPSANVPRKSSYFSKAAVGITNGAENPKKNPNERKNSVVSMEKNPMKKTSIKKANAKIKEESSKRKSQAGINQEEPIKSHGGSVQNLKGIREEEEQNGSIPRSITSQSETPSFSEDLNAHQSHSNINGPLGSIDGPPETINEPLMLVKGPVCVYEKHQEPTNKAISQVLVSNQTSQVPVAFSFGKKEDPHQLIKAKQAESLPTNARRDSFSIFKEVSREICRMNGDENAPEQLQKMEEILERVSQSHYKEYICLFHSLLMENWLQRNSSATLTLISPQNKRNDTNNLEKTKKLPAIGSQREPQKSNSLTKNKERSSSTFFSNENRPWLTESSDQGANGSKTSRFQEYGLDFMPGKTEGNEKSIRVYESEDGNNRGTFFQSTAKTMTAFQEEKGSLTKINSKKAIIEMGLVREEKNQNKAIGFFSENGENALEILKKKEKIEKRMEKLFDQNASLETKEAEINRMVNEIHSKVPNGKNMPEEVLKELQVSLGELGVSLGSDQFEKDTCSFESIDQILQRRLKVALQEHQKCGNKCPHLRRFFERIAFVPFPLGKHPVPLKKKIFDQIDPDSLKKQQTIAS